MSLRTILFTAILLISNTSLSKTSLIKEGEIWIATLTIQTKGGKEIDIKRWVINNEEFATECYAQTLRVFITDKDISRLVREYKKKEWETHYEMSNEFLTKQEAMLFSNKIKTRHKDIPAIPFYTLSCDRIDTTEKNSFKTFVTNK